MPGWTRVAITFRLVPILLALSLAACGRDEPAAPPPAVSYRAVNIESLPGWGDDDQGQALLAFQRSCRSIVKRPPGQLLGQPSFAASVGAWRTVCAEASSPAASRDPRAYFATHFTAYQVEPADGAGLFTGYYEPLLHGALAADERYKTPLYATPGDLVTVDLGTFSDDLKGRRIVGRVEAGKLVPYDERAAIDDGSLKDRAEVLAWVDDPIDAFFMAIQGSGQVALQDGSRIRLGYATQNGRAYRAIGRDLVEMGALQRDQVSMQTIRDWLEGHPDQAATLMAKNPSYVFYRELGPVTDDSGPLGGQGVPLTPERSLAVDRRWVAYGMPIWIDTSAPFPEGERPLQRLMVAQDTGGAIRGPVRGDVFWGAGTRASYIAGRMNQPGKWYLLLPRDLPPPSWEGDSPPPSSK